MVEIYKQETEKDSITSEEPKTIAGIPVFTTNEEIKNLLDAIASHHFSTYIHSFQTAEIAVLIAKKLGLSLDTVKDIFVAGVLHDIGKLYVPIEILSKPDTLRENDERPEIRQHPSWGYGFVEGLMLPNRSIPLWVYQHHERLNGKEGKGYPNGLRDNQILFGSRILGVADNFAALVQEREYKKRWTIQDALKKVNQGRNRLFDPEVVDALHAVSLETDIDKLFLNWDKPFII